MKDELFDDLLASAQEMVDVENEVIVLSKEDAEKFVEELSKHCQWESCELGCDEEFVGVVDAESLAELNELCKNMEEDNV